MTGDMFAQVDRLSGVQPRSQSSVRVECDVTNKRDQSRSVPSLWLGAGSLTGLVKA